MKRVKNPPHVRRSVSSAEEMKPSRSNVRSKAQRSASLAVSSPQDENRTLTRVDKMSSFGKSSSSSGSTGNLFRSQSLASLGGEKMVLGEGFRSSYTLRAHKAAALKELGLNSKSISKIAKAPRPKRTDDIFKAVITGLRDHVESTELDYSQADADYRPKASCTHNQKLKVIERHKKKLEYLLSKVEELYDHYQVQDQMREGTLALSKAYETSEGLHKKVSMMKVHYGYKECCKTMCAIEAQLESMLGQFHCEMKGIMGFARVMPGDSFEVNIRHGNQKWKSKGLVSKDNEQKWDQDTRIINIHICSSLTVKVFESKRLSKSSLGEKHCDILGLFAANPQILTVNVNDIGTIKLNILVQWMPLSNFTDQMKYFDPPPRDAVSSRPLSVIVPEESRLPQDSRHKSPHRTPAHEVITPMSHKPDILCDMVDDSSTGGGVRLLAEAIEEEDERDCFEWPQSLEMAVQRVRHALEEYQEHSSTMKSLFDLVVELDGVLENPVNNNKNSMKRDVSEPVSILRTDRLILSEDDRRHSSISLEIETAFKFLNDEECESDSDSETEMLTTPALSPTSTSRSLADSGIESLLTPHQNTFTRCVTPTPYSSGEDDLDEIIVQHCALTEVLLENLDNVGMLKSKERSALLILKQQKHIFSKIISSIADTSHTRHSVKRILSQTIPRIKDGHSFWLSNSRLEALSMTVPEFSKALHKSYNSIIADQYSIKADKVFNTILKRITKGTRFSLGNQPNLTVTLYQFIYTLLESKCTSLEAYIHEIASEVWLVSQLKSGNSSIMIRSVNSLKGAPPSLEIIKILLTLINSPTGDVSNAVGDYWHSMAHDRELRDTIIPCVLSCLEEPSADIRIGACTCLENLNATSTTQELVYVSQADSSKRVQNAARHALSTLNAVVSTSSLRR